MLRVSNGKVNELRYYLGIFGDSFFDRLRSEVEGNEFMVLRYGGSMREFYRFLSIVDSVYEGATFLDIEGLEAHSFKRCCKVIGDFMRGYPSLLDGSGIVIDVSCEHFTVMEVMEWQLESFRCAIEELSLGGVEVKGDFDWKAYDVMSA